MEGSKATVWGIAVDPSQRQKTIKNWTNEDMVRWFCSYTVDCEVTLNGILASSVIHNCSALDKLLAECKYTSEWDIWKMKQAFHGLALLDSDQKELLRIEGIARQKAQQESLEDVKEEDGNQNSKRPRNNTTTK